MRAWLKQKVADWKGRRRERYFMKRYGWVMWCPGCKEILHETWVDHWSTVNHWHYKCACGHVSNWSLIYPIPICDPELEHGFCDAA